MRVEELLAPGALAAVEAAVAGAERATSGEIVTALAERSDSYMDLAGAVGALAAFGAGALLLAFRPELKDWLLPTQICVFLAGAWLARWPPLLRLLAPDALLVARARRAAALEFQAAGVADTRHRTGILLYVSLAERHVVVLADRGIHERVPDGTWDDVVARVVTGIKQGRAEEGLIEAIRLCGQHLAAQFPRQPGDVDELPNRPRRA
jgi:putative membrane protein